MARTGYTTKYAHYNGIDAEIKDLSKRIASLEARPELSAAMQRSLYSMKANRDLAIARRDAANARRVAQ